MQVVIAAWAMALAKLSGGSGNHLWALLGYERPTAPMGLLFPLLKYFSLIEDSNIDP